MPMKPMFLPGVEANPRPGPFAASIQTMQAAGKEYPQIWHLFAFRPHATEHLAKFTQEIMHGYHKSTSSPKCAMKVDIMKAYDNVRWDFLWDTHTCMNFHPRMITWLKACVTTANYTLNINGEPTGSIKGERGLR